MTSRPHADTETSPERNRIRTALVVDDNVDLALAYKEILESRGHLVTVAHDGVQALKQVMQLDFDAILCDLMMPNLAGDMFYAAVERVKPHLCGRFVFITAHEGDPQIAAFLKRVGALVLGKPVTVGRLMGMLHLVASRGSSA